MNLDTRKRLAAPGRPPGVGVVEAVGDGVRDFAPGDAVLLSGSPCGACPNYNHPSDCDQAMPRAIFGVGGVGLSAVMAARRLPFDRLIRFYPFAEIGTAFAEIAAGQVIKPVLRMP